jgi:hypothetical protein
VLTAAAGRFSPTVTERTVSLVRLFLARPDRDSPAMK